MQSGTLLDLQPHSNFAITMVGLCLASLFIVAALMDRARRSKLNEKRLTHDWAALRELMADKELTRAEAALLESIIRRWSPDTPVRPATSRRMFGECVNKEMARLDAAKDRRAFAKVGQQLREIRRRLSLDYTPIGQQIESTRDLMHGQLVNVGRDPKEKNRFIPFAVVSVDEAYMLLRPLADGMHPPESYGRGQKLPCRIWREDDGRYTFDLAFDDIEGEDRLWRFNHSQSLVRHQAREYFRVSYSEAVETEVLDAPVDGDYSDVGDRPAVTRFEGRVTSLSAGGLAVNLPQAISRHVLLRMRLGLEGQEEVEVIGAIVSVQGDPGGHYAARCRFVATSQDAQDAIAHYVTRRQTPLAPTSHDAPEKD